MGLGINGPCSEGGSALLCAQNQLCTNRRCAHNHVCSYLLVHKPIAHILPLNADNVLQVCDYKCPHVPRNTHIKCLHWKGWQMSCCTCELRYTTFAVRTAIHCRAKRSLSVSMLLWGLPCPDLLGLNSVYAFLLTIELLFHRSRYSWNILFHFTFCLNCQEMCGLRLPPIILCYEAFLPSLPFVNLWWNYVNENILFVDICACGLWLVRWL